MQQTPFFTAQAEVTPENLGEAIQQAIEIEIATIPVYLFTYYSINRVPNQDTLTSTMVTELTRKGMSFADASQLAWELSASIMVFANKAGATIMSVVMEEMLHLALSSNLKQALEGQPQLVNRAPNSYPTMLPGHEPEFDIDLAPFSLNQLMTFLKIESPKPLTREQEALAAIPYTTIGAFYQMIEDCIDQNDLTYNTDLPQLVPNRGYYASNTIDTVYYDINHKPKYMDADDSGDLVQVVDRASAKKAIRQIVEQGEGNDDKKTGLNRDGTVNCEAPTSPDFDDPTDKELSHFEKFAQLYCEYKALEARLGVANLDDTKLSDYFVLNIPTNPTTAQYPPAAIQGSDGTKYPDGTIQAVSTLINAVYTYIFVMTEACYRKDMDDNTQYETFMFGIHKSMIFILNSLCGNISSLTYNSNGQVLTATPTFENYQFGLKHSPKKQLLALYTNAVTLFPTISYLGQRFQDLPDVSLS
jgi:hypothetical protein